MKIIKKILCKFGIHAHRVYGHAKSPEGTEYYYQCVFCADGFWDYAFRPKWDLANLVEYVPLEKVEKND